MINQVFLGLSYKCNLSCGHCYAKNLKNNGEIQLQKAINLIDEMVLLGVAKVVFSHGETFLYKDIIKVLDYLDSKNIYTVIMTNGLLLDSDLIEKLEQYPFLKVYVSLDSLDAEVYEKFRGKKGVFPKLLENLALLKSSKVDWGLSTTVSRFNQGELKKIFDFAISNGNRDINLLTIRDNGVFQGMLDTLVMQKAIKNIWIAYNKRIDIHMHDRLLNLYLKNVVKDADERALMDNNSQCVAGTKIVSIAPDGKVFTCNFSNICIGNIYDNSIENIIKSPLNTFVDAPCIHSAK